MGIFIENWSLIAKQRGNDYRGGQQKPTIIIYSMSGTELGARVEVLKRRIIHVESWWISRYWGVLKESVNIIVNPIIG